MSEASGLPVGDDEDLVAVALNASLRLYFMPDPVTLILYFLRRRTQGRFFQFPPFVRCYFREMEAPDFFRLQHYNLPAAYYFCRRPMLRRWEADGWAIIGGPNVVALKNFVPGLLLILGAFTTFLHFNSGVVITEYVLFLQPPRPRYHVALYQINYSPHF